MRPVDESGSITLWVLGLSMLMLFVGGISLDLWRAFSERRALAGAVDAAAVAGSSGIDAPHFRQTNELRLVPLWPRSWPPRTWRASPTGARW